MKDYTFYIYFDDGEVLCDSTCAASRFVAEMIMAERYMNAANIEFVSVN